MTGFILRAIQKYGQLLFMIDSFLFHLFSDIFSFAKSTLGFVCFGFQNETQEECLELLRVVTCMSEYDDAAYEDGLEWAQCVFHCKLVTQWA